MIWEQRGVQNLESQGIFRSDIFGYPKKFVSPVRFSVKLVLKKNISCLRNFGFSVLHSLHCFKNTDILNSVFFCQYTIRVASLFCVAIATRFDHRSLEFFAVIVASVPPLDRGTK